MTRRHTSTPWSEQMVAHLVQLWAVDVGRDEIAHRLGMGPERVDRKAAELDLPKRDRHAIAEATRKGQGIQDGQHARLPALP